MAGTGVWVVGAAFSPDDQGLARFRAGQGCKHTAVMEAQGVWPPVFVLDLETLKTMVMLMSLVVP